MPTPRIAGKVFGQLPIGFLPNLRPASVLSYEDLFRSSQRLTCHGTTCGSFDEHVVALRLRGHRRQFKPEVNKPNTNSALLYVYRPYTLCLEVRDWDALNRLFRKGYLHDALTGVRAAVSTFRWRPKLKLEIRPSYLENYSSRRKKVTPCSLRISRCSISFFKYMGGSVPSTPSRKTMSESSPFIKSQDGKLICRRSRFLNTALNGFPLVSVLPCPAVLSKESWAIWSRGFSAPQIVWPPGQSTCPSRSLPF